MRYCTGPKQIYCSFSIHLTVFFKTADDWIRTEDLWCWNRPLYHLFKISFSITFSKLSFLVNVLTWHFLSLIILILPWQTLDNWRYWVYTAIVGHFVHSFAHEVSSTCFADLESTSLEWVTNSMSLQQLRKGFKVTKIARLGFLHEMSGSWQWKIRNFSCFTTCSSICTMLISLQLKCF